MTSPFPGMDPYLEAHWRDVHHSLCTYARDALQPQLRPALVTRIEERLVVESPGEGIAYRSIYPETRIVERPGHAHSPVHSGESAVATAVEEQTETEPVILTTDELPTEGFIQIIDPASGGKLITVIEFLSITNKLPSAGMMQYKQKQKELYNAGVSLVEIDLLRQGEWVHQVPANSVAPKDRVIYRVITHRGWKGGLYEFYPVRLNQRLPIIRIPLREKGPDAKLNLQVLINQTYANGAYDSIDYRQPLVPPLDPGGAAWVDATLRAAGKKG